MKRLLIVALFLAGCFHSEAQAGGINVQVGRLGVGVGIFRPRVAVAVAPRVAFVPQQRVFVQRQFVAAPVYQQRFFAAPVYQQRVFAAPVYSQSFSTFAAPSYGFQSYGVQSFAAPGCGSLLAY